MSYATHFWISIQAIAACQDSPDFWNVALREIAENYKASSPEVQEQMRRELEIAVSRLIQVDRMLVDHDSLNTN